MTFSKWLKEKEVNESLNGYGVAKLHNSQYARNGQPTSWNDLKDSEYKGEIYKDKETAKNTADEENKKVHKPSQGSPVVRFISVEIKNGKIKEII